MVRWDSVRLSSEMHHDASLKSGSRSALGYNRSIFALVYIGRETKKSFATEEAYSSNNITIV